MYVPQVVQACLPQAHPLHQAYEVGGEGIGVKWAPISDEKTSEFAVTSQPVEAIDVPDVAVAGAITAPRRSSHRG